MGPLHSMPRWRLRCTACCIAAAAGPVLRALKHHILHHSAHTQFSLPSIPLQLGIMRDPSTREILKVADST